MADAAFSEIDHSEAMSSKLTADLIGISEGLIDLVNRSAPGVVAVQAAAYRVVSGVLLEGGLVALADHTLRREDHVPVHTAAGQETPATILGRDPSIDLAILKTEGLDVRPLPAADPDTLKPGSLAAVVGLTIDVGPSASLGILGAVGGSRRTWRGGTLDHFFRLDVNLYPSQSGAAVVSAGGELIGMATPGLLRHSAAALPVKTIQRVADELLKEGRIRYGYLGVGLQPVRIPKNLRSRIETAAESGLILLSVEPDSPAESAKLQVGDILISLKGKAISDIEDLQTVLRGDAIGQTVKAFIIRGGEPVEVSITIAERKRDN